MVPHHNQARIAAEKMLHNWKNGIWSETKISQNVFLSRSLSTFPSPDGSFEDPDNKLLIAIEFKPSTETKRGVLTGLGQTIAYLNQYSMSYFVCPERVEDFEIAKFMKKIFEINELNKKIPIGLISYSDDDPSELKLLLEILVPEKNLKRGHLQRDSRYWAKYVDATPDLIWTLLDLASSIQEREDRSKTIWRVFFDKYYYPEKFRDKLEIFDSKIKFWDGTSYLKPFSSTITELNKEVKEGRLSAEAAKKIISEKINPDFVGDNLFNSYKKNYFPLMDHLGLWDDQLHLSEIGYELHKIGKLHGSTSKSFKDHLTKVILIRGKHLDLILDIEKSTRNEKLENSEEARRHAYHELEGRGLVKKNPNRAQRRRNLGVIHRGLVFPP